MKQKGKRTLFSKPKPKVVNTTEKSVALPGFQLYFAGSQNNIVEAYLRSTGANRLASQLLDRDVIDGWINARNEKKATGHLFVDSGAFSAHTKNAEVDVDAYIEYINKMDDEFYLVAQVDKIPGVFREPKTQEELLNAPKQSWDNFLYMEARLNSPKKLMPIFHQGEDYKWLKNMLEWTHKDGTPIGYIGISPANDLHVKEKEYFIDRCFKIIKYSHNPNVQTHAFGMTSLHVLERYPFTSADSTSWILNGATGAIMTKFGSVTVSNASSHYSNHISKMTKSAQTSVQEYVEERGHILAELEGDYKKRVMFNIQYLLEWARDYEYKPSTVARATLF